MAVYQGVDLAHFTVSTVVSMDARLVCFVSYLRDWALKLISLGMNWILADSYTSDYMDNIATSISFTVINMFIRWTDWNLDRLFGIY